MWQSGTRGFVRLVGRQVSIDEEDQASHAVAEEGRRIDARVRSHGGLDQARLKLEILAARLRADGHEECIEGRAPSPIWVLPYAPGDGPASAYGGRISAYGGRIAA